MGKITRFYQQSGVVLGALFFGYQSVSADDHLIEINRVAAKVNNEIVTWGEIDRAMTSLNFTNSEKKERAPEFVDGKIDRLLSIYAFNDKGMAIPDSYIEQEYNKRLIQEFNGDRRLFRDVLRARAGPFFAKLEAGFAKNAFSYLLFLRLMPVAPFWAVNILPAFSGMRLAQFIGATAIGIIPGTSVYVAVGRGFDHLLARGETPNLAVLNTPHIWLPLAGLALLALLPTLYRQIKPTSNKD